MYVCMYSIIPSFILKLRFNSPVVSVQRIMIHLLAVFEHSFDIDVIGYYCSQISFIFTFILRAIKPLGIVEERVERRTQKTLNQQRLRKERKLKQMDQTTDQPTNSEKNISGQRGRGQSSEETEKRERGPESEADVRKSSQGTKSSSEGQGDVRSKMSIGR